MVRPARAARRAPRRHRARGALADRHGAARHRDRVPARESQEVDRLRREIDELDQRLKDAKENPQGVDDDRRNIAGRLAQLAEDKKDLEGRLAQAKVALARVPSDAYVGAIARSSGSRNRRVPAVARGRAPERDDERAPAPAPQDDARGVNDVRRRRRRVLRRRAAARLRRREEDRPVIGMLGGLALGRGVHDQRRRPPAAAPRCWSC